MKFKTLLIILSLFFAFMQTQAQITLDKSTEESIDMAYLSSSGYKYVSTNFTSNVVKLLNSDYSVWKTISLTIPTNYYLYFVANASENLFSTDGKVGLLYVIYSYNAVGQFYTYEIRVINENGTNLLTVPNGTYYELKQVNANGAAKLFTYIYDYSSTVYFQGTLVYQLPGQINTAIGKVEESPISNNKAYPNPVASEVSIPYTLPGGIHNARLVLTDMNGTHVREIMLSDSQGVVTINTNSFPSGIYSYQIFSDKGVIQTEKIIVSN